MSTTGIGRRRLFTGVEPLAARVQGAATATSRRPRLGDLVNVPEFEDVARSALARDVFAAIAGGDRAAFDRYIFRPRMLVPTTDLDLGVTLFGDSHVAPIIVGPVGDQRRYHPDGELATVRGASAARAGIVISSRSSVPFAALVPKVGGSWWAAVAAARGERAAVEQAVAAGCRAVCITVGDAGPDWRAPAKRGAVNWAVVDTLGRNIAVPVVVKGVMTPAEAVAAVDHGAAGVVVSNHGAAEAGAAAPMDVLPDIVDAVGSRATVLIDGSFRRGTDVLQALVLGARAVLVARPVMWGLAAYGAEGVQGVLELLQSDLGRYMAMIGAPNLQSLTRRMIRRVAR